MKHKRLTNLILAGVMLLSVPVHLSNIISFPNFAINASALTSQQNDLIERVGLYASSHYNEYKILPSFVVAQALQESAVATSSHSSGLSSLARLYHNYFGMKVGSNYHGASVNLQTGEQTPAGSTYYVNSNFRAYSSFEEGMKGYYEFIYGYTRYHNIIGVTDYKTVCNLIKQDGWATDVKYSEGLIAKIEKFNLTRFDNIIPLPCEIELSGFQNPQEGYVHTPGANCGLYGTITSNHPITHVWGGVYKLDGTPASGKSTTCDDYPQSTTSYSLRGTFNNSIIFDDIPNGSYYFSISAEDKELCRIKSYIFILKIAKIE